MSRRSMLLGFFSGTRLTVLLLGTATLLALSCALIWSSQSSSAATQGPVSAWSFDENTGATVEDLYGEADGTVEHAAWRKGVYGSALEFDGEESCVTVPNSETLQLQEEFTLEAWVRPNSAKEFAPVFFKEDSELDYGYVLMAGGAEGGHPSGYVTDGVWPSPEIEATAQLPLHVWSHLALTFDGAHIRLYVNGKLVASGAAKELVESHGSLRIGCGDNYGYWDYFDGRIDEPRVYERVLSASEIAADMQAPLGTPKADPVAEYSFDAVDEGTVEDLAGENNATVEGAKLTAPGQGRYGPALEFDGEESCVTIPDGPQFQMGEEFTLEAWVRPDSNREFSPIFYKQDGETGYGYALWAQEVEEGGPAGEVDDATYPEPQIEGKTELPVHTWSHLAFTYDGARMRLYVNGELVDSGASEAPIESKGPLKIGCADDYGYEHHFDGRIDEPRIYERALSPGEVAADMETPIQTPKAGPIAAYAFDEGEGGTAQDVTGHGHTATLEGGAGWARGRYGDALHFLKEGDCASVADSPELHLSEEFTLEAWVRPEGGVFEDPVVVRESGGKDLFGLGIGSREEGYAEAFIGEGKGAKAVVGGDEIRNYEWVHLAATWDGAAIRLYLDGELVGAQTTTTPPGVGEGALRIGCDTPDGPFGGRIDEVRVYGRALNGAEVAGDMEAPLQTPKQAPVAKYSFDEKNEETATDLTGDGHTATVEGAKWTEHGRYGGAYEFDAEEEDVLKIPASPELNFDEEFTLEAWVRPSGADNHHAPLIDKQEGSGLGYFLYEGGIVSDRPVGAVEAEQEHVHADDPLPAHAWSHVALTFTGNRTYLYVDGELIDNGAAEPVVTCEGELEIGGSTDTGEYLDGRVDEVRIYNRGLSAAEVAADMESPIQTPRHGAIAAWSFDEGNGETAQDITGNGNDGTIEGATSTEHGRYGSALEFDGKESCVTVPNGPQFQLGEEFTLEAWVRPESAKEFAPVFFKEDSGSNYGYVLWAGEGEGGVPAGEVNDTSSPVPQVEATAELAPHVWSHLAFTYDGAQMRLYANGELVDSGPAAAPIETDGSLRIGCGLDNGFPDHFEGRIDDARVYERALSANEVVASMVPLPVIKEGEAYEAEESNAVMTGIVDPKGLETAVSWEYGPTSSYGSKWPEAADDIEEFVSGNTPREVEQVIEELEPESTYHYRVVATNALGTVVGPDQTTNTSAPEPKAALAGNHFSGLVGVQYAYEDTATRSTALNHIVDSHAQMFRIVMSAGWGAANKKLHRKWNDELFEFMTQHHIRVLPDVVGVPSLPGPQLPPLGTNSEYRNRWKTGLKSLATRYGPGGGFWKEHKSLDESYAPVFWEIWNEENAEENADLGTKEIDPKRYGVLLGLSHEVIEEVNEVNNPKEEADKELKILFGGLLTVGKTRKKPPESEMKIGQFMREAGHFGDYDALSYHPYAFKGSVAEITTKVKKNIRLARRALNRYGGKGKKIWITEIGWPIESGEINPEPQPETHPRVTESVQAERLTSVFNMIKENAGSEPGEFNIKNLFWYNIEDFGGPKWDGHCGLFALGGQERSALSKFREQVE